MMTGTSRWPAALAISSPVAAAQHRVGDDQIDIALAQHGERFDAARRDADPVTLPLQHLDQDDDEIGIAFDNKNVLIGHA
jgi:hypothetical protein